MNYVLDIDDTLYLERDYVCSGFEAVGAWVLDHLNIRGFAEKAWDLFEAGFRGKIFDEVLKAYGEFDAKLIQDLIKIYRNHLPEIQFEPDVLDFLERHTNHGLFIITDGYVCSQRKKIQALNIERYFERIVVTDEMGRNFWKPNPRAFELIQGDAFAEDFVYIADNPLKDFEAPAKLGWQPSIRIRRRHSLHFELQTPPGCSEIDSLSRV